MALLLPNTKHPALFRRYPELQEKLPWISLTRGPTPVKPLVHLASRLGKEGLWMKRDDLCGQIYGGNKPRKLEFLLANALQRNAKSVMTLGALGSHHTLATAVYCQELGLHPVLGLANRPLTDRDRPNLISSRALGADLFYMPKDFHLLWKLPAKWLQQVYRDKKIPFFITPGGSSVVGCLGFVSAAFELAEQIQAKDCVALDKIYLPAGSLGTMAGLLLGLDLAGLSTKVIGIKIYPSTNISSKGVFRLVRRCHNYLDQRIESLPPLNLNESDITIRDEYLGPGYAYTTDACEEAIAVLKSTEDITLEHVYTGKCMAAFIDDAISGDFDNQQVMFWNTYNSLPFHETLESVSSNSRIDSGLLPYLKDQKCS